MDIGSLINSVSTLEVSRQLFQECIQILNLNFVF